MIEHLLLYITLIIINFLVTIFPGHSQELFAKYCYFLRLDYYSVVKSKNVGRLLFRIFGIGGLITTLLMWGGVI